MNTTKEEAFNIALECFHGGSMVKGGKTIHEGTVLEWTNAIENLVNQKVLQALEEVKSKYQVVIPETFPTGERKSTEAVPLSAIEQVEEKYR